MNDPIKVGYADNLAYFMFLSLISKEMGMRLCNEYYLCASFAFHTIAILNFYVYLDAVLPFYKMALNITSR